MSLKQLPNSMRTSLASWAALVPSPCNWNALASRTRTMQLIISLLKGVWGISNGCILMGASFARSPSVTFLQPGGDMGDMKWKQDLLYFTYPGICMPTSTSCRRCSTGSSAWDRRIFGNRNPGWKIVTWCFSAFWKRKMACEQNKSQIQRLLRSLGNIQCLNLFYLN